MPDQRQFRFLRDGERLIFSWQKGVLKLSAGYSLSLSLLNAACLEPRIRISFERLNLSYDARNYCTRFYDERTNERAAITRQKFTIPVKLARDKHFFDISFYTRNREARQLFSRRKKLIRSRTLSRNYRENNTGNLAVNNSPRSSYERERLVKIGGGEE